MQKESGREGSLEGLKAYLVSSAQIRQSDLLYEDFLACSIVLLGFVRREGDSVKMFERSNKKVIQDGM